MVSEPSDVIFFEDVAAFERWMEENHDSSPELTVGFWKAKSGRSGLTYGQAVDVALCFGWIDGIVRRRDDESYTHRFTPRRKRRSVWSPTNIRRVAELQAEGRMRPSGIEAFEIRDPQRTDDLYGSMRSTPFTEEMLSRFQEQAEAWEFFQAQTPSYRNSSRFWVMSAKREETRIRRFEKLISDSAQRRRIGTLAPDAPQTIKLGE